MKFLSTACIKFGIIDNKLSVDWQEIQNEKQLFKGNKEENYGSFNKI
ncbi:MAG: hypothetical protein IJN54_08130 [Lachnospiraceae bacterium]|nr:hypothetical protein [Lachnospiraceae bacterium]